MSHWAHPDLNGGPSGSRLRVLLHSVDHITALDFTLGHGALMWLLRGLYLSTDLCTSLRCTLDLAQYCPSSYDFTHFLTALSLTPYLFPTLVIGIVATSVISCSSVGLSTFLLNTFAHSTEHVLCLDEGRALPQTGQSYCPEDSGFTEFTPFSWEVSFPTAPFSQECNLVCWLRSSTNRLALELLALLPSKW